jgi:hypothetical protein
MSDFTPENFASAPAEHAKMPMPRFALCVRWGSWMLTQAGLFRWGSILAAKPMRNGKRAKRFAWVKIYPRK